MTSTAHAYPEATALPARLDTRLQRLSQRVRVNGLGHRRLSETDTRRLTATLLRDIDETILPRHVRVQTNAGQQFALDIAGRRLLRLVVSGSGGSVGQPDDSIEAAKALATELKRSLMRATELTIQSVRMDSAEDRTDVGSSAAALAAVLGLDLEALDGENAADRVARSFEHHARAFVTIDGRGAITARSGDPETAARLDDLVADHMAPIAAVMTQILGRDAPHGCLSLGTDSQTGAHLVVALSERTRIVALVDPRRMTALLPVLQDIFAQ